MLTEVFYNISNIKMEQLIAKMSDFQKVNLLMKRWCDENSIQHPKIMNCSLEKISKLYDNFLSKYGLREKSVSFYKKLNQPIWFENQLILFQWSVVALGLSKQISLKNFTESQFQFLSQIFRQKQIYVIEYEIKCMVVKGKQIRNSWNSVEQDLLASIIKEIPQKNKWNQIARQLYKRSEGKYFRQGKHCRQRWFSYVQNKNIQQNWNIEDDISLLQLISARGKKWNQLANKFTNLPNKSYLKKRFKHLLRQAKNKSILPKSEREAIQYVLQEKQLQLQQSKNKDLTKPTKRKIQRKFPKNQQNLSEQSINFINKPSSILNQPQFNNLQNQCIQNKENQFFHYIQEPQNFQNIHQSKDQNNLAFLNNNSTYFYTGINIGYYPVQYLQPNIYYTAQLPTQQFNYLNLSSTVEQNGKYFVYL